MELLYIPEHRKCIHYESISSKSMVEVVQAEKYIEMDTEQVIILYILQGTVDISYGKMRYHRLHKEDFILFPPGIRFTGRVEEPMRALIMRMNDKVELCDKYTLENLYDDIDAKKLRQTHLKANMMVKLHMDFLAENVLNGLRCTRFLEIKTRELFYYLRAYYEKQYLAMFCLPLLSKNATFMDFVWKNYRQAHNVEHFAKLANCSLPTFKLRFKRTTGMSAGKWLTEQKVRNVYHEIRCGNKNLKEICKEYHFSSLSHLGTFSKKHFDKSPGHLRLKKDVYDTD